MASAKARAIVVYIYSCGASWLIICLQLAARWVRLVCDDKSVRHCILASGIRINTDVLNYFSTTPLRTSARRYLGLAAIATAGLSATIVSWFAGLSTTIYTVVECMLRCAVSCE